MLCIAADATARQTNTIGVVKIAKNLHCPSNTAGDPIIPRQKLEERHVPPMNAEVFPKIV